MIKPSESQSSCYYCTTARRLLTADTTEETGCLHLSHALGQVGWNGRESFPSAVHDVVAARAHGGARASADAARLHAGRLLVAWK